MSTTLYMPATVTVTGRSGQQYKAVHWEQGEYRMYRGNAFLGVAQWYDELGLLDRFQDGESIGEAEWQSVCDAVESSIERSND